MNLRFKRWAKILCATHALALLIGVSIGYWLAESQRAQTRSLIEQSANQPLEDAAELAFRFGTAAHAKTLHAGLREGDPLSLYLLELKRAFLDGEHVAGSSKDTHLARAASACQRAELQRCDVERLRHSAGRLAKWRPQ